MGKAIPFSILFLAKTFFVSSLMKLSVALVISIILTPGFTFPKANFKAALAIFPASWYLSITPGVANVSSFSSSYLYPPYS